MKNFSNRIWVLVVGVIVALVIAASLILIENTPKNLPAPSVTQKPAAIQSPSVVVEKTLKAITQNILKIR